MPVAEESLRPRKEKFTGLDAIALARDLRALDHPRVDKGFDFQTDGWILSFRVRPEGRRDLVLVPGQYGALTDRSLPHGESPGPVAREIRRLLSGAVLTRVLDPAGERILEAEFSRTDGSQSITLVVEFFGSGNLVLVQQGRIVAVAHPKTWAHRTLRTGVEYKPAPGRNDPWSSSSGLLEVLLLGSTADRASTLATRGGFGGTIAEELLERAHLEGSVPAPTDAGPTAAAIHRAARELREELEATRSGYRYRRDGEVVDVAPHRSFRRLREAGTMEEVTPEFGSAVLEYFLNRVVATPTVPAPPSPRDALLRQKGRQQEAIQRLQEEVALRQSQGERIFERYEEAERARAGFDREGPEVVEVPLGELTVPLHRDRPVESSARALFEESKRVRTKLDGARAALIDTEKRLAQAPSPATPASTPGKELERPRKSFWFERFRWFFSSEGILVLGGRDASTNDLLVKRHLRDGDRYVHADLHGAASVIVKRSATPGPGPGEPTLREAGQWAVAFSKAWRAGHASGDAFWVMPEQVSKTAASGEFVARGAWVIHGTKNVLRDLPMELGIGTVDHESVTLWTVAPATAFRDRGAIRFFLTPGEERMRADAEVELAKVLGVPRPRLQSLLPAGGLSLRRA